MAAASTSRKRGRGEEDEAPASPDPDLDASHLVSFLTGYDTAPRDDDDDDGSHESDENDHAGSDVDYGEADNPDDEDDMDPVTPTKRSKTGLVGTRGSRSTPRSKTGTPSKRKTTPRKPKTPSMLATPLKEGMTGFLRMSKADAYFLAHSQASKTSGNSYSALVRPLAQAQYDKYTTSARSKGKDKEVLSDLQDYLSEKFLQWELELLDGFNILLYGFGSKRRLLNRFVKDRLSHKGHCVVVNGHFPHLGIRDVLAQIEDTLSIPQDIPIPPSAVTPLDRSANRIYAHFLTPQALHVGSSKRVQAHAVAEAPLFLLIHNIDSPLLRSPRSLAILSLLACSPNIHLIASFDHIHTPLLFSTTESTTPAHSYPPGSWTGVPLSERGFNWIYHNATTYDDYDLELTYQRLSSKAALGGITSSSNTGISEEGAMQILRSVPPMALRLIKLLLTRQLASLPPDPKTHTSYVGSMIAPVFATDNDTLQRLSREKFIAREEERYNALMGEFRDHGLVVEALQDGEGRSGRWIWVPLGKAAVERVLETIKDVSI